MNNYILPNPFFLGSYKIYKSAHERILDVGGASETSGNLINSNLLKTNTTVLQEVLFKQLPDSRPQDGHFFDTSLEMMKESGNRIAGILPNAQQLLVIGGDHTVTIGTGFGMSKVLDMSSVGMIYIDSHGDSNTPDSSPTKSIYGYPAAISCGFGHPEYISPFNGNFIKKIVHIGVSDIDEGEIEIMKKMKTKIYSSLDIVELGLKTIIDQTLEYLKDMKYIWLSIDIDAIDPGFLDKDETDVPVAGGMLPRELMYLTYRIQKSGKLKVTEIVQVNDTGKQTPIITTASRIAELSFGLGHFRYGK